MSVKKVLWAMAIMLGFGLSTVNAQTPSKEAILVKISDIKVNKNDKGETVSCDFDMTVYNRSESNLSGAKLDIKWGDETIKGIVADEEKRAQERAVEDATNVGSEPNTRRRRPSSVVKTAEVTSSDLLLTVDIPEVKSYQQIKMVSQMKTDRCFLLIAKAEIATRDCRLTAAPSSVPDGTKAVSGGRERSCAGMFEYVSSKDEQYYKDFKKITPEEERLINKSKFEKMKEELEADYQKVISSMSETNSILGTIAPDYNLPKADVTPTGNATKPVAPVPAYIPAPVGAPVINPNAPL